MKIWRKPALELTTFEEIAENIRVSARSGGGGYDGPYIYGGQYWACSEPW